MLKCGLSLNTASQNSLIKEKMTRLLLLLVLITNSIGAFAQSENLSGNWLITRIELSDKVQEPFFIIDFREDGIIVALEMEIGTWEYDVAGNKIIMKSGFDKNFNGENKILMHDKNELVLDKNGDKYYYRRINYEDIYTENESSKLQGTWNIENENNATMILKFDKPDAFIFIDAASRTNKSVNGTWIFDSVGNNVIIIGNAPFLRGDNKILKLTENELILENHGELINASKEISSSNGIERLDFNSEDLARNNSGKYQLPWTDFKNMISTLEKVKYLKYKMGKLIEETNKLKYSSILSSIDLNSDNNSLMFINFEIEDGDTLQFSENYKDATTQNNNSFFPMDEPETFRIVGVKTLNVPAGSFECTIVEGMDGDTKIKYWMINDHPGVYARIIVDGKSVFDELEYSVMDLLEIKTQSSGF